MSFDDIFSKVEFANQPREDKKINEKIDNLVNSITKQCEQINPFVVEYFKDPDLFHSLPEEIKKDREKLAGLILNMGRFWNIIHPERKKRWGGDTSGLFSKNVYIPETEHSDGRTRRAESGYRINVDYLRTQGIDPLQVLFFRVTQSTDTPKPEYYWTSDYFETQRGLTREISPEQRKTAIILVASLNVIDKNGGLIQDINDDSGLAVRQIGTGNFDQKLVITRIKPNE